jgi:hypothetical protein
MNFNIICINALLVLILFRIKMKNYFESRIEAKE